MSVSLAVIFLLLALLGVVIRKTYYYLPARELKRRAEKHDAAAMQLYRAVAYGNSLRGLLWLYIGLTSAVSLVLLARSLPVWLSLLIVGPLLWIAFSMLPASRTTSFGLRLTRLVTPLVAWLLNYLHPLLSRSTAVVERRYTTQDHTGLYERADFLELIKRQHHQPDSRLTNEELEIITRTLQFDDHRVRDVMTPRKRIKILMADDTIGPILIDEVHKSGQPYALVRESAKGAFVGTLLFNQLNIGSTGKVRDTMEATVYYLHENDSLGQALHAFFVTNQPLFVVIDNLEDFIGVLTIADVLRQLLGHIPGDDFDQYADPTVVAARHTKPKKDDKAAKVAETPVQTEEEVLE
jgi:CBS domain containing-hemolysin-like protein